LKITATKEFPIELSDDSGDLSIQPLLVSSPKSVYLSVPPTEPIIEPTEVNILSTIVTPIPIRAKGLPTKVECSICVTPTEVHQCKSSQTLSLPTDCHQPKDWNLSLALTIGQPSSTIKDPKGKRVFRKLKDQKKLGPYPSVSTNPQSNVPIAIQDFPVGGQLPADWSLKTRRERGEKTNE